jgi:hypothetical protein
MFMPASNITLVASATPEADAADDPVPGEVRAVIELFTTELAKIAFPEIDAATLRRHADELRADARAADKARSALDAALAGVSARRAALGEVAGRAIAYARIYSQAHPDRTQLAAALAALSEPAPLGAGAAASTGSPTGRRRGRPPRRSAELFDAAAHPDGDADADAAEPG